MIEKLIRDVFESGRKARLEDEELHQEWVEDYCRAADEDDGLTYGHPRDELEDRECEP